MQVVETEVVNIHGDFLDSSREVTEPRDFVVATHAMPNADRVRIRAYCWTAGLLHFDKVLQIPLIIVLSHRVVSYCELNELFSDGRFAGLNGATPGMFPVLTEIRELFVSKAEDIQSGGREDCHSNDWLNIWWSADEYILIKLCVENKLEHFYTEVAAAFVLLLESKVLAADPRIMADAIYLNKSLLKTPFQQDDFALNLTYNIWEYYRSAVLGTTVALEIKPSKYHIDRTSECWKTWEDWYRTVIWYGNKKGAYLYSNAPMEPEIQLAGHF